MSRSGVRPGRTMVNYVLPEVDARETYVKRSVIRGTMVAGHDEYGTRITMCYSDRYRLHMYYSGGSWPSKRERIGTW